MTVGIGVLGSSFAGRKKDVISDTAILIADTMGSFDDVDSHARLHKGFTYPESGMYAVGAGRIDYAAELTHSLSKAIADIPIALRHYGAILTAIAATCYMYKRQKFTLFEFPQMRLPPTEIDPRTATPDLTGRVQERWENFSIGCDLILAIFDLTGRAHLFQVNGAEHELANIEFPGFGAIGSGSENAIFWLSRRQHTLGQLPLRAAYHAYEAKLMAEGSAHVNEHLDMIVATASTYWVSSTHQSASKEKEHSDINLAAMKRLKKRFWPRDTSGIGQ